MSTNGWVSFISSRWLSDLINRIMLIDVSIDAQLENLPEYKDEPLANLNREICCN